jgi:hypothetical protein
MILAATITIPTIGWIAIFIGMAALAWLMKLFDAICWPWQRRIAYEFWLREQQGEFDGKRVRVPKNYHRFIGEFEAGRFPGRFPM